MRTIAKALEARWFLLAITILLWAMAGVMYSLKSELEAVPSAADLQRSLQGQQGIKKLVPGPVGEAIVKALAANEESQLFWAEFASRTRELVTGLALFGLLGCVVNLTPRLRRRVMSAVQPGAEPDGVSTRGLTP